MKVTYELIDFEDWQLLDGKLMTELEAYKANQYLNSEKQTSRWVTEATANELLILQWSHK